MRRDPGHVRDRRRTSPARGPDDRSRKHLLKTLTRPDIVTVTHRVIVHADRALFADPRERKRRALVFGAPHSARLEHEQDVDVLREVLERIPFLFDGEGFIGT